LLIFGYFDRIKQQNKGNVLILKVRKVTQKFGSAGYRTIDIIHRLSSLRDAINSEIVK
jgi:hypothetical protein